MPFNAWKKLAASKFLVDHRPSFFGLPGLLRMQETVKNVNAKLEAKRQAKEANQQLFPAYSPGTWNDSCSQGLLFWWFKVQTTLRNRALNEPCLKRRVYIFYIEYEQETGSMFASLGQGLWYDFNLWFKETSPNLWMSSFQVFSFCIW